MFKPLREKLTAAFSKKPAQPYATLAEVSQAYVDQQKAKKTARYFMYATNLGMLGLCGAGIALVTSGMALTVLPIAAAITVLPVFAASIFHSFKDEKIDKRLRASEDTFSRDDMNAARPADMVARIQNDYANKDKLDKHANILSTVSLVGSIAVAGGLFGAAIVGFGAMGVAVGSAAYVTAKTAGFAAYGLWSLTSIINTESSRLQNRQIDVMLHSIDNSLRHSDALLARLNDMDDAAPAPAAPATPAFDAAATPKAAQDAKADVTPTAPAKRNTAPAKKS